VQPLACKAGDRPLPVEIAGRDAPESGVRTTGLRAARDQTGGGPDEAPRADTTSNLVESLAHVGRSRTGAKEIKEVQLTRRPAEKTGEQSAHGTTTADDGQSWSNAGAAHVCPPFGLALIARFYIRRPRAIYPNCQSAGHLV
jgi:hypothetical protein